MTEGAAPDLGTLADALDDHGVEYVVAGSVAAMAHGAPDVRPADLDVVPAVHPANLARLEAALASLGAKMGAEYGEWSVDAAGEREWVQDGRLRPARPLDAADPTTFDHWFETPHGRIDVVPEAAGTFEALRSRAVRLVVGGAARWVASANDVLAAMTRPRRAKDAPRVRHLRSLADQAPAVTDDLDAEALAHLGRMPEAHRLLLEPLVRADAADAWLRRALMAYLRHLARIFDRDEDRALSEAALVDELCVLAGTHRDGDVDADLDAAETELAKAFEKRGYRFLGGRTPPHLGPYVWHRTETRRFTVTLPRDEPQEVTVHFMHDFVLRGWRYWETFGEHGAGGWYQDGDPDWPDGLYCVADRYPEPLEDNRSFQVSLLGHEAQHVADQRAYPGLTSAELEYRAKLVELIGYESVDDRLAFFLADAADDPEQPHPYAAHRIVTDLASRLFGRQPGDCDWTSVPYDEIRRHSRELLDEDTARLTAG